MKLEVGDVVAYKGSDGLFSSIIKRITKSKYSHLGIFIGSGLLVEADGYTNRVRYRPMSEYKNSLDIFTCKQLTDKDRQKICDYAISQIGDRYSYFLTLWMGVKFLFHVLLPYIDTKSSKNCSELVNLAYDSINLRFCPDKWPTPEQVISSELLVKIGEY